jgi:8-oxo-dGTP pyrophosphatase MutT (NUDIX family)
VQNSSFPAPPRRGVVAVIVRDERLLVIRRSHLVRAPQKFCFPGGGVEAGETDAVALIRELQEELTVPVVPLRALWSSYTPSGVQLAWWLAGLPRDVVPFPNPAEVESFHWLARHEIRALPELLPTNHAFLDAWEAGVFEL